MNLLEAWVATPLAGAVGWTLLHSLWQGAMISATLAAVLAATRSPRIRYAAACVAMLVMVAGCGLTLSRLTPGGAHGMPTVSTLACPPGMSVRNPQCLAPRLRVSPQWHPGFRRFGS